MQIIQVNKSSCQVAHEQLMYTRRVYKNKTSWRLWYDRGLTVPLDDFRNKENERLKQFGKKSDYPTEKHLEKLFQELVPDSLP
jgi:hypothetical protein